MHKIDILMATYNSEKYISEQLQSIINQTYKDFHLYICDDVSTDSTSNILSEYKLQYNNTISILKNETNKGAKYNFSNLFQTSQADYIMFSDHDDVWLNNKIEVTYNKMIELENKYSKDIPILVFTDKFVTDDKLNITAKSHNKSEKFNTNDFSLNRLLMGNVASGCTIMVNAALRKICGTINSNALMHDYWLMLTAAAFGNIGYINIPTMYYRQHNNNQLGAQNNSLLNALKNIKTGKQNLKNMVFKNITQAEAFYNQYENLLSDENKCILKEFIKLRDKRNISFIKSMVRNKFYKSGILKNLGLIYAFM